jgi:outer membrane receptor protein involved in Fe transport
MLNNSKSRYRNIKIMSGASTLALLVATSVNAQTTPETPATSVEEIVVTGSRIARPNEVSATPVNSISAEAIAQRGVINVVDVLTTIPQAAASASTPSGAPRNTASGVYTVSLRSLGANRTLVLVDGRRYVAGEPGTTAVDLNTIPTDLIDRVEVTTGGASAVYGSDAVAGVVNFIMKKNFEGVSVKAQAGSSSRGDGEQYKIGLTAGGNFADDKGNAVVYASYDESHPVFAADRDRSGTAVLISNTLRPDLAVFGPAALPPLNSRTGVFGLNGSTAAGSSIQRVVLPDGTISTPLPARDSVDPAPYTMINAPTKHVLFGGGITYALNDKVNLFSDLLYSRNETENQFEPTTLSIGPGDTAVIPNTIPVSNPFIPAAMRALIPAGRTDIAMSRSFPELGPSRNPTTRDLQRIVIGANGTVDALGSTWRWDSYYEYGRTSQVQRQLNRPNRARLYEGLHVESDGAGGYRCANPIARTQGCVPLNFFTGNALTAPEVNYIRGSGILSSVNQQQVAGANFSGDLFTLPAGPVGFAAGVEWRHEAAQYRPDDAIARGQLVSVSLPSSGSYSAKEIFAEMTVPLLKDQPFAKSLDLEAAFRRADYSTFGASNTYKLGASYEPVGGIRFRGMYATALRAPNINELYSGETQGVFVVADPCVNGGAGAARTYCLAQPGVTSSFTANNYRVNMISGGNNSLTPETAKTLTAGFIVTPSFIPRLTVSVDYYDIRIRNAITTLGVQLTVNQCATTNDAAYCSLITRDGASGLIAAVRGVPINAAATNVKGVDVEVNYRVPLDDVGGMRLGDSLSATLNYTWLKDYKTIPLAGAAPVDMVGQPYTPEHKANLRLNYVNGRVNLSVNERYTGKVYRVVGQQFAGNEVDPKIYTDLQARFNFTPRYALYVGMNNAFDVKPPLIPTPYVQTSTGTNTAAGAYDVIGRALYAGIDLRF